MAAHDIYIDLDRGVIVTSQLDSSQKGLPRFVYGAKIPFKITLFRNFQPGSPYETVPVSGLTITASLGPRGGGSHLSDQPVWTPNEEDLSNPYWSAYFPLNTPALQSAFGSEAHVDSVFEVTVHDPEPWPCLQETVRIWKPVAAPGDLVVPEGLTVLTTDVAENRYQNKEEFELPAVFRDKITGKKVRLSLDTEGAVQWDPQP
jgi:hypothetical protein